MTPEEDCQMMNKKEWTKNFNSLVIVCASALILTSGVTVALSPESSSSHVAFIDIKKPGKDPVDGDPKPNDPKPCPPVVCTPVRPV